MLNLYDALQKCGVKAVFILLGSHAPAENWLKKLRLAFEVVKDQSQGWEEKIVKRYRPEVWVNDRLDTSEEHVLCLQSWRIKVVSFDDGGSGARHLDLQVAALAPLRCQEMAGRQVLTGLEYLILPQEISRFRRLRTSLGKLVVSLGGSDTHGITVRALSWLEDQKRSATVLLGPGFVHKKELEKFASSRFFKFKRKVPSLAAEFSNHEFAVTGGGLTAFEAAAAGLPALTVANEVHEIGYCRYLDTKGCSKFAGFREEAEFGLLNQDLDMESMSRSGIEQIKLSGADNLCRLLIRL
ncbi:MAG: PseG/SpsG family protein [Gammaproteobacteria bacterium]